MLPALLPRERKSRQNILMSVAGVILFATGWLLGSSPDINLVDNAPTDLPGAPPWVLGQDGARSARDQPPAAVMTTAASSIAGVAAPAKAEPSAAEKKKEKELKLQLALEEREEDGMGTSVGMGMSMGMGGKVVMDDIKNYRGVPDSKEKDVWMRKKQNSWRLIILFQHNYDILEQAVDGYRRASDIMASNIIVVDNSDRKEAVASKYLKGIISEVIPTPRLLNFPELHNYMADIAVEKNLDFFFWAHADNYVLPWEDGRDLGKDVVDCMRRQIELAPNWGMMLFSYDHLAAFRTQTMAQVPWDPLVFQYGSECDAYGRLREVGYDAKACKVHLSYDMKRIVNITDKHTWAETKAILDEDKEFKSIGRNKWREDAISDKEQEWRTRMKLASRAYLEKKWGKLGCKVRGLPCSKPWPYCPKCPDHIDDCYDKDVTRDRMRYIHAESRKVFATNPEQPEPFETSVKKT